MAPMILGFILGDLMEDNLRRALPISGGSVSLLLERPITLVTMLITVAVLVTPETKFIRERRGSRAITAGEGG